jgi:hypothetical protein
VEELLWGEARSLADLAPSLRDPFDVIIMADVVYDVHTHTHTRDTHLLFSCIFVRKPD